MEPPKVHVITIDSKTAEHLHELELHIEHAELVYTKASDHRFFARQAFIAFYMFLLTMYLFVPFVLTGLPVMFLCLVFVFI